MAVTLRWFGALAALAGVFLALELSVPSAGAEDAPGTTTETIVTDPSTDTTTDSTATTTPAPLPGPKLIEAGVTVGGVLVGGLTGPEARQVVAAKFSKRLVLVVSPTRRFRAPPQEVGAAAFVGNAVKRALRVSHADVRVPLEVAVSDGKLARYVRGLADVTLRAPADARLVLRGAQPRIVEEVPGRQLQQERANRALRRLLKTHTRNPYQLPFRPVRAKVPATAFGQVIVIRRESKFLSYFQNGRLKRTFRVATGRSSYPTPIGRFAVVNKQQNPWWYPPASDWAKDASPIPPGPGNPLGTRWMGLSAPQIGIHGTPDSASIGYSASHGCVRMLIPQVEWLFERIRLGATVFIVAR
jgi:lipoprotein-anchoring transpeptidase ErfK/SrfK